MFNDINGKENHLVKLDKMKSYTPPNIDNPPAEVKRKTRKRKRSRKIEGNK